MLERLFINPYIASPFYLVFKNMTTVVRFTACAAIAVNCLLGLAGSPLGARLAVAQAPHDEALHDEKPSLPVEPQTAEFKEATEAFREHLKKMREVMVHYNTTPPGPQDREMRSEWFNYLREGVPLYHRLLGAAVAEYQLESTEKAPLAQMLWEILKANAEIDRYEGLLPVAQALLASDFEETDLRDLAVRTAFALNEYAVMRQLVTESIDESIADPQKQGLSEQFDELDATWAEELAAREQDAQGPPLPRVLMHTTKGDIEIELFENQAPESVANFISLVESGFYNGLIFHRVIEQFMAQTGCPVGDGSSGPGYTIHGEAHKPGARKYFRGTLGMALSGHPDSGGSQFFITFLPRPDLNGKYTAFGRVTAGIDVLSDLVRVDPDSKDEEKKKPAQMLDEIVSIEVLSKRDHDYQPNKVQ